MGEPFTLFALHDGVLDTLEQERWQLLRAPLGEYLWFLWRDAGSALDGSWAKRMADLGRLLGMRSIFSPDLEVLRGEANRRSPDLPGPMGAIVSPKPWNWGAGLPVCLPCPPGMRIPPQCWT